MTTVSKAFGSNERAVGFIPAVGRRYFCSVLWLLLAGFFIVCHGCHGDEDKELSAPLDTHTQAKTTTNPPSVMPTNPTR
jgi:hypothetical protein